MVVGDAKAMDSLGNLYYNGADGLAQDYGKALELYHRAAELGCAQSMTGIGKSYYFEEGVERDKKKVKHYLELGGKDRSRLY